MDDQAVSDREYWQHVVVAGAATSLPRWCSNPQPGTSEHEEALPQTLETALHQLADKLAVPVRTLLLGAHVKVLSALSGEVDVTIGYQASQGALPLPCVLTTPSGSWRELLLRTRRSELDLISHQGAAFHSLARELGLSEPSLEVVFDMVTQEELHAPAILQLGISRRSQPLTLRFRYRTDALDPEYAARIAGYHLQALTLMVADPEQLHQHQGLLTPEETSMQLEGLAGPRRELPDRRVHEEFEEQVRLRPEAVAAKHRGQEWSYRHLNLRANQLGRALLARGVGKEGVVAVVTERNLDWMASVLAIFKAGAVYLPIEPHFPSDRIAKTLTRSDCVLALTEAGSTTTLDKALDSVPEVQRLFIEEAYQEGHPSGDLGIDVAADQLAYIYFTSGSTGEPKGAMCEHVGMLNHIYAKIDDLGIDAGQVVAQTAPQCFDISLWQLVSPLLVGGRTLLIEQKVILDVERLVDQVVAERVAVLQLVPSYLEAVLTHLEQKPRELPDLRCVSVTGEALKRELVQRWFALEPDIKLVNAYGLTETSDDTNHEVMVRAPDSGTVPLGRPISNVHVYVVDERQALVPLGAPGEIVFSGVCVGRGYVNDPERTGLAFLPDPHRRHARSTEVATLAAGDPTASSSSSDVETIR